MNRRQLYLLVLAIATLVAVWWAAGLQDDGDASDSSPSQASVGAAPDVSAKRTTHIKQTRKTSADAQAAMLAQLRKPDAVHDKKVDAPKLEHNPFATASFQPPPAPPGPPPKPTAPPLRFQYQGLLNADDKLAVFLADGTQFLIAHVGDTLAGQYRVEKLTDKELVLTYLPLNVQQTLNFGRR
ncbi:MAG TPA: hypothetical protein VFW00_11810 [Rhodocyclaceae bacterium]|nr:hypothetical protein [Rhodocyclaceae bacterium]